jgi:hypothetical protein
MGNSLEPLHDRMEAAGAREIVNDLMATGQKLSCPDFQFSIFHYTFVQN